MRDALALAADFRYAGTDGASGGQPEIRFGIIPGAGATQRLQRLAGRSKAKELIYSGRWVNAAEALSIGIVDHAVECGGAYPAAFEAAVRYASAPAAAIAAAKAAIQAQDAGAGGGLDVERDLPVWVVRHRRSARKHARVSAEVNQCARITVLLKCAISMQEKRGTQPCPAGQVALGVHPASRPATVLVQNAALATRRSFGS